MAQHGRKVHSVNYFMRTLLHPLLPTTTANTTTTTTTTIITTTTITTRE